MDEGNDDGDVVDERVDNGDDVDEGADRVPNIGGVDVIGVNVGVSLEADDGVGVDKGVD